MLFLRKFFIYSLFLFSLLLFLPTAAFAEDGYSAKEVSRSFGQLRLKPGAAITFEIKFKNIGTQTWLRNSNNFLEIVTAQSIKRKSDFEHKFWEKYFLPTRLLEESIAPGEIGTFRFALQAPEKEGEYVEHFTGVARLLAWVDGMDFSVPITVTSNPNPPKKVVDVAPSTPNVEQASQVIPTDDSGLPSLGTMTDKPWAADLLIRSRKQIQVAPGEKVSLALGFKNVGTKTWKKADRNFVSFYTIEPKYHRSLFYDSQTWLSPNQVRLDTDIVEPGQLGYFNIQIQAPETPGVYVDHFNLAAEDKAWFSQGDFELLVQVVPRGSEAVLISQSNASEIQVDKALVEQNIKIEEPLLRVGIARYLEEELEPIRIGSGGNYTIEDPEGNILFSLKSGIVPEVDFDYSTKIYSLLLGGKTYQYPHHLIFRPEAKDGIMELIDFEDRPSWNPHKNYNQFRGVIEIYHSDFRNRIWIINEVDMDLYLRGLVETSNPDPMEYLKAMSVAGRSYAMYHFLNNTKHAKKNFHVDAFYDQVYKGYIAEAHHNRLVDSIEATKGIVVTYDKEVVLTPYFAHSDGATRNWEDVWGGTPKPWAKAVSDPYNVGRAMFGHGVGLSARGAKLQAQNDAKTFDEILQYYYTDIGLQKIYN